MHVALVTDQSEWLLLGRDSSMLIPSNKNAMQNLPRKSGVLGWVLSEFLIVGNMRK